MDLNTGSTNWKNGAACPYCGSDQIEGESFDAEGAETWQTVRCLECDREWVEVYALQHAIEPGTIDIIAEMMRAEVGKRCDMSQHTPIPWFVGKAARSGARVFATQHGADGVVCAGVENRANADFIVRACNAHDDFKDRLYEAQEKMDRVAGILTGEVPWEALEGIAESLSDHAMRIRTAIAKATATE